MLEKLSKMSVRESMIALAGCAPAYGELPRWLSSIARTAGLSFRTTRSLWLNEIRDQNHLAAREIKRLAKIAIAKRESRDLAASFETIAGGMNASDADFFREDVAALLDAARALRGLDRP